MLRLKSRLYWKPDESQPKQARRARRAARAEYIGVQAAAYALANLTKRREERAGRVRRRDHI